MNRKHNKLSLNCDCGSCVKRKQEEQSKKSLTQVHANDQNTLADNDVDTPLPVKKQLKTVPYTPTPQRRDVVYGEKTSSIRRHKTPPQRPDVKESKTTVRNLGIKLKPFPYISAESPTTPLLPSKKDAKKKNLKLRNQRKWCSKETKRLYTKTKKSLLLSGD